MKQVLLQLLTGIDGETHDLARWCGLLSVMTFLGLEIANFIVNHTFDATEFGIGLGAVFAATGAFIKLKESTEPSAIEAPMSQTSVSSTTTIEERTVSTKE